MSGFKGMTALATGIAASAIIMISPAMAQDAASGADGSAQIGGIQEIVVTAQKRAQSMQDVPISITAVDSQALKNQQINSVADVSKIAPNVQLDTGGAINASAQILNGFIRGIGQNDNSSSLEPGVGIYLDGVILARSIGANVDLLDVERIEVLKGPQGTLFGRNTIGGAISIVTRDPAYDFQVRGEATVGSRNRFDLRGTVDVPLSDTLGTQFSFSTKNQDGYQKIIPFPGDTGVTDEFAFGPFSPNNESRRGNSDMFAFRGKVMWEATADLTFRIAGDYSKADEQSSPITLVSTNPTFPTYAFLYNVCVGSPPALFDAGGPLAPFGPICGSRGGGLPGADPLPGLAGYNALNDPDRLLYGDQFITDDIDETYGNGANRSEVESWGLTGQIDLTVNDNLSIKSITGYREVEATIGNDLDGSPIMIATSSLYLKEEQISQELQFLVNAFDERLQSVFGLYYFNEKNDNLGTAYLGEGLGQFYGPSFNDNKSYAAYMNNSLQLSDAFSLTIGARYTKDKKTFSAEQADLNLSLLKLGLFTADQLPDPTDPTRLYPLGEQKDTYNDFSVRLGAEYKITPDVMVYASFAQGFKSGGYTTRLSIPTPGNIAPRFDPEEAETYEIGVKSQLFDRRLQLNVAAFRTDYTNLQTTVVRGISPFIENAGSARIEGFEVEAVAVPIPEIRLTGSVGYLDARYTSLDAGTTVTLDNMFVNTPKWSSFVAADIDLFEGMGGTVTVHGDYAYKSRIARDAVNTPDLIADPQHVVNGSLRWTRFDEGLEFKVGVQNLTDERYIQSGTSVDAVGATTVTYSRPREYFLTVSVKY